MPDPQAGLNLSYGRTGLPGPYGDGVMTPLRVGRTGANVGANAHGWHHEAATRGNIYHAAINGSCPPGTALATVAPLVLWNPTGSNKDLSILSVRMGFVSGTLGAGSMAHAMVASQGATKPTGVAISIVNGRLGAMSGVGQAFQSTTSLAATPTLVQYSFTICAQTVTVSNASSPVFLWEEVAGNILVPPGTAWVFQEIGAGGTAPLVTLGVTWEEVPIPA